MANLRANAERFKQKEAARLQAAAQEEKRLNFLSSHRASIETVVRSVVENFPCIAAKPDEAAEQATKALLSLAAKFSSAKSLDKAVEEYRTEVASAIARRRSMREEGEAALMADLTGAVAVDETLVELTEGDDGQRVPSLPDLPEPYATVMAKILEAPEGTKQDAKELFALLDPVNAERFRRALESASALAPAALRTAYVNMTRQAESILRKNKAERAEEADEPKPKDETTEEAALRQAAESLATDLAYAEGVIADLTRDGTAEVGGDLKAASERIKALVNRLKDEASETTVTLPLPDVRDLA